MTPTEQATIKVAESILSCPRAQEAFALEEKWAPGALLDVIDAVVLPAISQIQCVGNRWRIIQLTLLRDKLARKDEPELFQTESDILLR